MRMSDLVGNPDLDREEIRQAELDDVRSGGGLPDGPGVEIEMAEAFGWNVEESPEEVEAHYESWLRSQRPA